MQKGVDQEIHKINSYVFIKCLIILCAFCAERGQDREIHKSKCEKFTYQTGKNPRIDVPAAMWNNIIQNKTFGVFGRTSLGLAVARRLRQLGANKVIIGDFRHNSEAEEEVVAVDGEGEDELGNLNVADCEVVGKNQFMKRADIVCVCDGRTNTDSEAVFDQEAFKALKPGVILVNTGCSQALNYSALYEALRDREILAAGLNTCNQSHVGVRYLVCVFVVFKLKKKGKKKKNKPRR